MARHSEINHIINNSLNLDQGIKYIPCNSSIDYLFIEQCKSVVCPKNINAIPCSKIIAHDVSVYDNNTYAGNKHIIMHNGPDIRSKKEDIFIFKQKLNSMNIKCIFLDQDTMRNWQNQNGILIPYGIPISMIKDYVDTKRKDINEKTDIAILNLNRNPNIEKLHHKMINDKISCHYLDRMPDSIYSFIDIVSKYRVIINLESINVHNTLLSIYSGCFVISPTITKDITLQSLMQVTSFADIYKILKQITALKKDALSQDKDTIETKYNDQAYLSIIEGF